MNKLITILALTLTAVTFSFGNNTPDYSSLQVLGSEKAVILNLTKTEAISFVVYDETGEKVYSQEVAKFDNGVKYIMANLAAGQYTFKVAGNNFVELHDAVLTETTLNIENTQMFYKPSISENNNKIVVNTQLSNDEDISVTIFDDANNLVYDFNDHQAGSYSRSFDLNQLYDGKYKVVVSTDYFYETQSISIDKK